MYGLNFSQFSRLHPFHLIIDANMLIVQAGAALRKILPDVTGKKFYHYFELKRPGLKPQLRKYQPSEECLLLAHLPAYAVRSEGTNASGRAKKIFLLCRCTGD
jgi:heme-NO-binding protein